MRLVVKRLGNRLCLFSKNIRVGDIFHIEKDDVMGHDIFECLSVNQNIISYGHSHSFWDAVNMDFAYRYVGDLYRKVTWLRPGDEVESGHMRYSRTWWNVFTGRKIVKFRE